MANRKFCKMLNVNFKIYLAFFSSMPSSLKQTRMFKMNCTRVISRLLE